MARVKQGIRMLFFKTGKIQGICLKIVKTCFYTENLLPTREILSKKYREKVKQEYKENTVNFIVIYQENH